MTTLPRPEFPNPQFERKDWLCLNGEWLFETDTTKSGTERGFAQRDSFNRTILVPFCPESALSGIADTDFLYCVWYMKHITLENGRKDNKRVFLHFGACDFQTTVWINGSEVGTHSGGYSSFSFDITEYLTDDNIKIVVRAIDDTADSLQPSGKQSMVYRSSGCNYTRTTGIWQTVWLEFTPIEYIKSFKLYPDSDSGSAMIDLSLFGEGAVSAEAFYEGRLVGTASKKCCRGSCTLELKLSEKHLWEPGAGRLYDLKLRFGSDEVVSYFGLRNVAFDGMKFLFNGKSLFQRLVLDQGFYPDGIYTAPTDEDLARDIKLSMDAGFNGARLHQKVFEPRFLYHCDKMGYLVWGEYGSWGADHSDPALLTLILPEWLEILKRDFNHPSIVCWCPFNETWNYGPRYKTQDPKVIQAVYLLTKSFDNTRPCVDTSGNYHVETDIFDVHDYSHDYIAYRENYKKLTDSGELYDKFSGRQKYRGEPVVISEYGGLGLDLKSAEENDSADKWSYGKTPSSYSEFFEVYGGLTDAILDNPSISGFCYTQLYDVEQEQNGLYTYQREPKVDISVIKAINTRKAAIEE